MDVPSVSISTQKLDLTLQAQTLELQGELFGLPTGMSVMSRPGVVGCIAIQRVSGGILHNSSEFSGNANVETGVVDDIQRTRHVHRLLHPSPQRSSCVWTFAANQLRCLSRKQRVLINVRRLVHEVRGQEANGDDAEHVEERTAREGREHVC